MAAPAAVSPDIGPQLPPQTSAAEQMDASATADIGPQLPPDNTSDVGATAGQNGIDSLTAGPLTDHPAAAPPWPGEGQPGKRQARKRHVGGDIPAGAQMVAQARPAKAAKLSFADEDDEEG